MPSPRTEKTTAKAHKPHLHAHPIDDYRSAHSALERILTWWAISILGSVLLVSGALYVTNKMVYGPTGQVSEYFRALREGNGSHALALLNLPSPEGDGSLLDGEPLRRAYAPLKNLRYEVVSSEGDQAVVRAFYTVNGTENHSDFPVHRVGTHWGFFDKWAIDAHELPQLQVSIAGVQAATVNNRKVAVDQGAASFPVFYPGVYTTTYDSTVYTTAPQTVLVDSAAELPQAKLALAPAEGAQQKVTAQMHEYLEACASKNTLYPAGCPFSFDFAGRVQGAVTWKITQEPTLSLTVKDESTWSLSATDGRAQISFTQLDLYSGKTQVITRDVPFKLTGSVSVEASDVHVTIS